MHWFFSFAIHLFLAWLLATALRSSVFKERSSTGLFAWGITLIVLVVGTLTSLTVGVIQNKAGGADGLFCAIMFFYWIQKKPQKTIFNQQIDQQQLMNSPHYKVTPYAGAQKEDAAGEKQNSRDFRSLEIGMTDEDLWIQALQEFESSSRRPGLWARVFAEANGDESVAKAGYLRMRIDELQQAQKIIAEEVASKIRAADEAKNAEIDLDRRIAEVSKNWWLSKQEKSEFVKKLESQKNV